MESILEVENLSISFTQYVKGIQQKNLPVIRNLSVSIAAGQIVAVVGSSGSGKSLLAHGILGILPYNSHMEGDIRYCGQPLTEKRLQQARGSEIVLVPQGAGYLDPLMKVGNQICKGKKTQGILENMRTVLTRYGLGKETENLYPFELSGGMARRILISTAVMESPKLVIADEPTPGLDAVSAKRILGHFREIADEGAGVLFITHDLETALSIADRVVVFYAGENLENAAASDFKCREHLRHPYTKALWDAMPQHDFKPIPGAQPYPGDIPAGCLFSPRCPVCRPECELTEKIPYKILDGGGVRCLYPERSSEL